MRMLKKHSFLLAAALLLGCLTAPAQEKLTVSGRVVDAETGEPLIAVGILQQGTSNGVISAMDGDYAIVVPRGAVLVFSSIGYVTQEIVVDRTSIDIALEVDNNLLDEVVVVGYGVQKKSSLTGAVSSVKSVDLQARGVTDMNQALSGKTAGVQTYASTAKPGSQPSLQVRGIGSNGSSAPLYVIDGRISDGPGWINPNDIESIEVLKDASSAAIYGAAAGNGVILITTKKGHGEGTISYDMQITSQSIGFKPRMMNSEEFIDYWTDAGSLTMETVYRHWDGKTNTDWLGTVFEPSLMQKHSLTFQGGNDKGQLYVSGSYMNNDGMIEGDADTHSVLSGMVNASYQIKPWLEIGTNNVVEYSTSRSLSDGLGANVFLDALGMLPIQKPYLSYDELDDAVKPFADQGMVMGSEKGYYSIPSFVLTNLSNPFVLRDANTNESRSFSLSGTTYANLKPWSWLTMTSRLSYMLSASENYSANHAIFTSPTSYQKSLSVSSSNGNTTYWQWENFATAMKAFGDHFVTAMLGQSYSQNRLYSTGAGVSGNENDPGFAYDDPRFLYFRFANATVTRSVEGGEPFYTRKIAYFGRLNYSYKDKYLLQASLRADAADLSVLPASNRWGFFPAVSAGWVVSKESFMEGAKNWLSQLKLRASWGQNGSVASLGNYMYSRTIGKTGFYPFSTGTDYTYAYSPSVLGNDGLKWETSEQLDFGVDLAFLGNRLTLNADWYRKETRDLIISDVRKSYAAGFDPSPINAGTMLNTGVELELGWQDQIGDFSYGVRGNLTTLLNRVTNVAENMDRVAGAQLLNGTIFTMFEKDMPAWYFYGYKYTGVDPATGDPVFDGMGYLGKGIPDMTYGITLNAAWKGIDLVVFGSGVQGVDIYNAYNTSPEYVVNRLSWFNEDRWSAANPTGTKPRFGGLQSQLVNSSFNVFDGSYFKIKQIQLGYTLPKAILSKIHLSNLRLYASLENFFTFTKYIGFDPEVVGAGSSLGVDYGYYPNTKKVLFGLNITF